MGHSPALSLGVVWSESAVGLQKSGRIYNGKCPTKPDVSIKVSDKVGLRSSALLPDDHGRADSVPTIHRRPGCLQIGPGGADDGPSLAAEDVPHGPAEGQGEPDGGFEGERCDVERGGQAEQAVMRMQVGRKPEV